MKDKAISVSQLSAYIKGIFDAEELLHNISVYGEISGLSVLRGNAYFTLKDEDSLLQCVYFGADEQVLKNGDLIVATGTPRYYAKGGKLNFNVVKVEPYGIGDLFKKFLEIKTKLDSEGLFNPLLKKKLPEDVKKIGVVSSEKGAVIQDIINVTKRRNIAVNIVLYPSRVQGDGADKDIIEGIKYFDEKSDVDVIIVARGGGSFEDLMPFNSEELARVVYKCEKPVVSAVGHETDFTIIDFVSDLRAPTPSAAAELVVSQRKDKVLRMKEYFNRLSTLILNCCDEKYNLISSNKTNLDYSVKSKMNEIEYSLGIKIQALEKLNPIKILQRGFAKIEKDGKNVNSVFELSIKDTFEIYLKDGKIKGQVKSKEELWLKM